MKENEAIKLINDIHSQCCDTANILCTPDADKRCEAVETAIKALKEIQKYRALEKRLTDMFGGELSLEDVTEELERYLKEPGNPHPVNAKILTYEDAADWDAYRAIGTPEECRAAMEKQTAISREVIEGKYFCPKCHNLMPYPGYCGCGQRLY